MARTDLQIDEFRRDVPIADPISTVVTSGDGGMFANNGKTVLRITATTGDATITVVSAAVVDGFAVNDYTGEMLHFEVQWFGPFESGVFNQTGDDAGKTYINTTANVTVAVFTIAD